MLIFNELKNISRIFYPAILLEEFMSHKERRKCRKISFTIMMLMFIVMIMVPYVNQGIWQYVLPENTLEFLIRNIFRIRGIFLIFFVAWAKTYLIEAFYLSHYFKKAKVDFEVAKLVYISNPSDMTHSFIKSEIGQYTMDKLGILDQQINSFIKDEGRIRINSNDLRFSYNARKLPNDDAGVVNLADYMKAIFDSDQCFRDFLIKNNITEEEFFGGLEWVQNIAWKIRDKERFWSKENLMRVPSIGRNWSLNHVDYLEKFTHLIYENDIYKSMGKDWRIFREEAEITESFLLDKRFNNVMLIADNVTIGMQIVSAFGKMIAEGFCLPKFQNKKVYIFNSKILLSHANDPDRLKRNFVRMIKQAQRDPDVIIVFPNFANFIEKSLKANVDIFQILKEVLQTQTVPFISIVDKADFSSVIEPDFELMRYFDKYVIPKVDKDFVLRVLQNEAHKIENKDKRNITFPVINKIAEKHLLEPDPIKSALIELHRIYE